MGRWCLTGLLGALLSCWAWVTRLFDERWFWCNSCFCLVLVLFKILSLFDKQFNGLHFPSFFFLLSSGKCNIKGRRRRWRRVTTEAAGFASLGAWALIRYEWCSELASILWSKLKPDFSRWAWAGMIMCWHSDHGRWKERYLWYQACNLLHVYYSLSIVLGFVSICEHGGSLGQAFAANAIEIGFHLLPCKG